MKKPIKPCNTTLNLPLEEQIELLKYPLYASPKIDGLRCILLRNPQGNTAYTYSGKLIQNEFVQKELALPQSYLPPLDGELVVGDSSSLSAFKNSSGALRRKYGSPNFTFWVFDLIDSSKSFQHRLEDLRTNTHLLEKNPHIKILPQILILDSSSLTKYLNLQLFLGFEGICTRAPLGRYKHGRSTAKEQLLMKIKPLVDAEAKIIGFNERMKNLNEPFTNELGHQTRSSHQDNKIGMNMLGSYIVKIINGEFKGKVCHVSPAFHTHDELRRVWNSREKYLKLTLTFTYQSHGSQELPRSPKFKCWRPAE